MWALSGSEYDPDAWSENSGQCTTMSAHTLMAIGSLGVQQAAPNGSPVLGAGSFDRFFRDALRSRSKHENLFSGTGGDLYTPALSTAILLGTSAIGDGSRGYRDSVMRAVPLLWLGIGGSSLFTESSKRAFGRKRPFLRFNNRAAIRSFGVNDNARESFFSGHASSAFFTAAFTDRVLADIVRAHNDEYCFSCGAWDARLERAGQSVALYGLATYVGYSRIEIDKHFMTDVLAGAFVGGLVGQLTYWMGYRGYTIQGAVVEPVPMPGGLAVQWRF